MIVANRVPVGATAVKIAERGTGEMTTQAQHDWGNRSFALKNLTGTATIYLGGDKTVTAQTGFPWEVADGPISRLDTEPGEELWGVSAGEDQTVAWLRQGR